VTILTSNPATSKKIFLIEDNLADINAMEEALKSCDIKYELKIAQDGEVATRILSPEKKSMNPYLPDIILLDLNLPKKNGRELLKEIKVNELLRQIPIIVLTSSKATEDISLCYRYHVNCYITKPAKLSDFFHVIKKIIQFWCEIIELPDSNEVYINSSYSLNG